MIETEPGTHSTADLPTPTYHIELRDYLKSAEPELWAWFTQTVDMASQTDDEAELALLKSAYRLDGGVHDVLVGYATLLAERFELSQPVALYQELNGTERNARVFRLNGRINVVFGGDLLDLLTVTEQQAVLAHELAHIALWSRSGWDFYVLDQMVHRLASDPQADDALVETARRLRLHTEVWADAASAAVGDLSTSVSAIVKVASGLRHVDPGAYLRQAEEILALDSSATAAWTHPELHIRVACLSARARNAAADRLATLINGPDDLDRLDVLGQRRIQHLTARVLSAAQQNAASTDVGASDGVTNYLDNFPELSDIDAASPIDRGELADQQASVRWLAASLLVDLALVDDNIDGLAELQAFSAEAQRQGVAAEFDKILARATDRSEVEARKLREATE